MNPESGLPDHSLTRIRTLMRLRSDCPPSATRAVATPTAVLARMPKAANTISPVSRAAPSPRLQPGQRRAASANPTALRTTSAGRNSAV